MKLCAHSNSCCFRYRERIVWTNGALTLKFLRRGILTRIYTPMVSLIQLVCLRFSSFFFLPTFCILGHAAMLQRLYVQVIIQSLRESGVFSSVIASAAQANLSKDQFISSVNSSTAAKSGVFSSRKVGNRDLQTIARRMLEFTDNSTHSLAIPPLSPPSLDDFQVWHIQNEPSLTEPCLTSIVFSFSFEEASETKYLETQNLNERDKQFFALVVGACVSVLVYISGLQHRFCRVRDVERNSDCRFRTLIIAWV